MKLRTKSTPEFFRLAKNAPDKCAASWFLAHVYVVYCDLFITSLFGYLPAAQASIELVEMIELQDLLCQAGTIDDENKSGGAGVGVGGGFIVTRVKDGCHTELKVGQVSEGQQGDKGPRHQIASESAVKARFLSPAFHPSRRARLINNKHERFGFEVYGPFSAVSSNQTPIQIAFLCAFAPLTAEFRPTGSKFQWHFIVFDILDCVLHLN